MLANTHKKTKASPKSTATGDKVDSLLALFQESIALFHGLRAFAETVYGQGELSASLRGVLLELEAKGAQTVPQMARARPTSRQHIQVLVNELLGKGLVEYGENPAHVRSKLVRLTIGGQEAVDRMHCLEKSILSKLDIDVPCEELVRAREVLQSLRSSITAPSLLKSIAAGDGPNTRASRSQPGNSRN
jgi:DNA-binding MarR family transcriptional regulator